jgi:hypothetical protein
MQSEVALGASAGIATARHAVFCHNVTSLSPERPADVLFDPATLGGAERANRMFNCYGWNTFVALFWPAKSDERGVPVTTKSITDAGPRVWETYKQTYEVFQPATRGWSLKHREWNGPQQLPRHLPQRARAADACTATSTRARIRATCGLMVLRRRSRSISRPHIRRRIYGRNRITSFDRK